MQARQAADADAAAAAHARAQAQAQAQREREAAAAAAQRQNEANQRARYEQTYATNARTTICVSMKLAEREIYVWSMCAFPSNF
jgi:hypothetical protein